MSATENARRPVQRPRFPDWSRRMSQVVARKGTEPLTGSRDASLNASFMFDVAKPDGDVAFRPDRKSTRLNSSHVASSYAVFGSKKKKGTGRFYLHIEPNLTNSAPIEMDTYL